MKNRIIRPLCLLITVILLTLTFTSCSPKPTPPDENAFSLVMDFAPTTIKIGEKITYKAILKNAEHESYELQHTQKLIYISVVKEADYKDENNVLASSAKTNIAPHGQIEEFYDFKPTEAGKYILKAFTTFDIEGKKETKSYSYECEEIVITVV